MRPSPIVPLLLGLAATVAHGQQTARLVKYHANDIVSVRAKMRYTTLIELPSTEKILEVATGDKDFWIIDTVGNYCFLHPAKEGIHSNLNLITDKGTVYSFTLDDVESGDPDLKVVIAPSDPSSLAAANGAGKLVSASEVDAARAQAQLAQSQTEYRMVLLTKGEYSLQELRISESGLKEFFTSVFIVERKDRATFERICADLSLDVNSTWSVGDSLRSDIKPALAAGLGAFWIPQETWSYENADEESRRRLVRLRSISQLPRALRKVELFT